MTEPDTSGSLQRSSTRDLWRRWRDVLSELRKRGVLRSTGNPVGDYAEYLVAEAFGLKRFAGPNPAIDAIAPDGTRYSIKARRWEPGNLRPTRVSLHGFRADAFD